MKILFPEPCLAGFLTAVYHAYYTHKDAGTITSDPDAPSLIDTVINIETDTELAGRVRAGIIKKAGSLIYGDIADAYLSCQRNKERVLFSYVKFVLARGRAAYRMYGTDEVIAFNDLLNKVRHEAHRFLGFLRFKELESGIYYSGFSGDNDILELLVPHFKARLNSVRFVLHDTRRQKLVYYDGETCHYLIAPEEYAIKISDSELLFSSLWKDYHKNVSIDSRLNPRQQRQCLPKKYRWFMNEF